MVEIGNSVVHKLCSLLSSIHLLKKKKETFRSLLQIVLRMHGYISRESSDFSFCLLRIAVLFSQTFDSNGHHWLQQIIMKRL